MINKTHDKIVKVENTECVPSWIIVHCWKFDNNNV